MPHSEKLTGEEIESCAEVARIFAEHRSRYGLTQVALARMIKKSPKTVSAIMTARMRINVDMGIALAKALEVPLVQILPKLSELDASSPQSEIMGDLGELTPENREMARKMVRRLLDSQED